ncbi:MAG TPA: post-COAP-1 domain-containing protein [Gemmatimonadales bacterium]|nr:post-COAP-1 domain-containing protein [Gemmatimonadales bacterium]
MTNRIRLLGVAIPTALLLAACSDDPAAPPATPEVNFHEIKVKCDFFTGGGFVGTSGSKITFGLHAGRSRGGTVFGHLTVVNHASDTRYQSTEITRYGRPEPGFVSFPSGGVTRIFEGRVRINGSGSHPFTAYVNDSGEPGRFVDRLFFRVAGREIIVADVPGSLPGMRLLNGGNLQFHAHCIPGNPQSGK